MTSTILNPYQKNSIEVTLRSFEQNLVMIRKWLNENDQDRILFSRKNPDTPEQRLEISQKIDAAFSEIAFLKEELNLQTETESLVDYVRGQMSLDWEGLLESRSRKLSRFGKIVPEAASIIDPHIQSLADIALSLSTTSEANHSHSSSLQNNSKSIDEGD